MINDKSKNSKGSQKQPNLDKISIQINEQDIQSPRFGGIQQQKHNDPKHLQNTTIQSIKINNNKHTHSMAGKYGQSQYQFMKESEHHLSSNLHHNHHLAKHNNLDSAWISLKGIVYDVTTYMKHHPGGEELLEGCGAQSQKLFDQNHSWVNAKSLLANWVVGVLDQHHVDK